MTGRLRVKLFRRVELFGNAVLLDVWLGNMFMLLLQFLRDRIF